MLRVGLTGGIGSGKSRLSAVLAQRGGVLIDSDLLAREVVEPGTTGLAAVVARFGADVLDADGALDRPALGARIFADADGRRDLEGIVHPLVRERAAQIERAAPADAIVVHDIPLLVETRQAGAFDLVVVVDVPVETQVARLGSDRGMVERDARARIAAQAGRAERTAVADVVVDNTGSVAELEDRANRLWDELVALRDAAPS